MLNEEQLTLKEIQRRMTSLTSSMESLQRHLLSLCKISAPSPALQSAVVATLEYLLLTTAGLFVLQSDMDRLYWTSDSAPLLSLREHWRTALENLESNYLLPGRQITPSPEE